jgi:hypothetical protein
MSIVLVGSTSGSVTLQEPAVAGTTVLDLPATSGTVLVGGTQNIPKSALPTGSVLQVVQTVKSDTFSMSSSTFADITGLSVSITPTSSSSKILVLFSTTLGILPTTAYSAGVRLLRGSTSIYIGDASGSRIRASGWVWNGPSSYNMYVLSGSFLDSPATTSSTTYKLQAASGYSGQTLSINRDPINADADYTGLVPSQITLMEIAA